MVWWWNRRASQPLNPVSRVEDDVYVLERCGSYWLPNKRNGTWWPAV